MSWLRFLLLESAPGILSGANIYYSQKEASLSLLFLVFVHLFLLVLPEMGPARMVAEKQPMKLAAMEGLYEGKSGAGLVAIGILKPGNEIQTDNFVFSIRIPNLLSYLCYRDINAFVPGIKDMVYGNEKENIISCDTKIEKGKRAITALVNYKQGKDRNNTDSAKKYLSVLNENYKYFGYGYLNNNKSIIPNISVTFYSFRFMVLIGTYLVLFFIALLFFSIKNNVEKKRWLLIISLVSMPLVYLASVAGWLVAEFGRQPWVIQDILPTGAAVSNISSNTVVITFILFAIIFTALLVAEIKIMLKQIKLGYKEGGNENV